jgi:hypothetical protein
VRTLRDCIVALVASLSLVALHCDKDSQSPGSARPVPSASAPPLASSAPAPSADPGEDSRQSSVYPLDAGTPDPLAQRLCSALHDLPEQRRTACCDIQPGIVFTSECVRMLTSAVRVKAASLDAAEVDRCITAMGRAHEGCEWVGPYPPDPPKECLGIVHGALARGARCRSSLECGDGLRCQGASPMAAGRCGPPRADGEACGAAVDPLVVYVKQSPEDPAHRECSGYCDHLRCASKVPNGGACRFTAQCESGGCASGKCAPVVPAKAGEACPTGECSDGSRCLLGKCVQRKPTGGACKTDFECLGACLKSDGGGSLCGRRCDVR